MRTVIPGWLLALSACSAIGDTISFQPASLTVNSGQSFAFDVDVATVSDLYAFQFDIGFDPTILSAVSVAEGLFLPSGGSTIFFPGTIDNVGGTITFNADSLVGAISGVTGSGILANIMFNALAAGTSPVALSNLQLLDSSLNPIAFSTANGSVSVKGAATPEPSALPFLGAALLCLAAARLKRANVKP